VPRKEHGSRIGPIRLIRNSIETKVLLNLLQVLAGLQARSGTVADVTCDG
jgi:hypothetical protein